jgi:hypothetical protein
MILDIIISYIIISWVIMAVIGIVQLFKLLEKFLGDNDG